MTRIFKNPGLRAKYCYAAHAFVDKQKVRPVQTADILAWQQATQVKRWLKNDYRMRKDFQALAANPRHELFIGNRKTLGVWSLTINHCEDSPCELASRVVMIGTGFGARSTARRDFWCDHLVKCPFKFLRVFGCLDLARRFQETLVAFSIR